MSILERIVNEVEHIVEFIKAWAGFFAVVQAFIWPVVFFFAFVSEGDDLRQMRNDITDHVDYKFEVEMLMLKSEMRSQTFDFLEILSEGDDCE